MKLKNVFQKTNCLHLDKIEYDNNIIIHCVTKWDTALKFRSLSSRMRICSEIFMSCLLFSILWIQSQKNLATGVAAGLLA